VVHPGFIDTDPQAPKRPRARRWQEPAVLPRRARRFGRTPVHGGPSPAVRSHEPNAVGGVRYKPRCANWGPPVRRSLLGRCRNGLPWPPSERSRSARPASGLTSSRRTDSRLPRRGPRWRGVVGGLASALRSPMRAAVSCPFSTHTRGLVPASDVTSLLTVSRSCATLASCPSCRPRRPGGPGRRSGAAVAPLRSPQLKPALSKAGALRPPPDARRACGRRRVGQLMTVRV
jgi:hypothetical protein